MKQPDFPLDAATSLLHFLETLGIRPQGVKNGIIQWSDRRGFLNTTTGSRRLAFHSLALALRHELLAALFVRCPACTGLMSTLNPSCGLWMCSDCGVIYSYANGEIAT